MSSSETSTQSSKRRVNVRDAAYLAAMIDGEGYISGTERPARETRAADAQLLVRVCNTSTKLLDWLHTAFNGRERWREPRNWGTKRYYEWEPLPEDRLHIFKAVLPHMVIKHDRMLLAIGYLNSQADGHPVQQRQKLVRTIQRLNKR
jgi:hypothetical protein